jgi:tetratricopeptide (TPR) repeat protein
MARGDIRFSMELATEALAFAERRNDPGMIMEALFLMGLTSLYCRDFAAVRDYCSRAVAEYDDRERTQIWAARIGQHAGVTHRFYLSLALWHLGYPDQALKVNREAWELARTLGRPFMLAYAANHAAWLYQYCRLGPEAVAAAEETGTIAAEQGFARWRATAMIFKAGGIVLEGRPKEAIPLFLKGLDAYRATGAVMTLPHYLSMLVDAYTHAGRFEDAHRALDEALSRAENNDDRFQEAELHRLQGELLLAESPDQAAAAEACFRQSVETARRQQSRAWELRATMSLARLWQRQGRCDEAREMLATVYGKYTEGFATPDLVDAAALLQSLEP